MTILVTPIINTLKTYVPVHVDVYPYKSGASPRPFIIRVTRLYESTVQVKSNHEINLSSNVKYLICFKIGSVVRVNIGQQTIIRNSGC